MTLATVSDVELRAELWLSFLGVLKAYAVLAHPAGEPVVLRNLDDSPDSVLWSALCRGDRRRCALSVTYDAKTGNGKWRLSADDEPFVVKKTRYDEMRKSFRSFTLNADGSVSLDGSVVDMDHAAIQLMGWFASTVKTGQIELPV